MTALPPIRRTLGTPERLGTAATARHRGRLVLPSVMTDVPTVVLVRQGLKQMTRGDLTISLDAGEAVMVPSALAFDLINTPSGGGFVATMLSPAPHLIDEIAEEYPNVPAIRTACPVKGIEPEFLESFDRAASAASEAGRLPPGVVENREREVLIWLAHKGLKFGRDGSPDVAHRVRALVSQDLARNWKAHEVARAVAMSEATMRRRLGEQGLSFQQLLIDVRMTRALSLLQVTDLPVGQIALEVGYDSASRFAARFKQRFDVPPSAVRA